MLKVLTDERSRRAASVMSATMALESMPPERNAPSGTSDIIWRATARPSVSRSAAAASASSVQAAPAAAGACQ